MRIAVYSGSFDPLHIGHRAVLEYLSLCPDYDWTYLVVSPRNPLKDPSALSDARARFEAARVAVAGCPGLDVWVESIELGMAPPQYTITTLDALRLREPGNSFTLVIGADNLDCIRNWKDYRRILGEYGVAVFPRKGSDAVAAKAALDAEGAYSIRILDAPLTDISSTEIRAGEAQGKDMSRFRF